MSIDIDHDPASNRVIGLAIEIHRSLGPGLLESAYEECFALELKQNAIAFQRQVPLAITYKGMTLDCSYRLDFVIEQYLVVELKSVERLLPIHEAQLLTYLKLSGMRVGLLMNFNVRLLKDGIKRLVL
jgi:GxxExxY protein